MQKLSYTLLLPHISLALQFIPAEALAQSAEEKPRERIQVTGSRIKKIDAEGSNPVTVIGKDQIEKTGSQTVRDLLQNFSGTTASFSGGGSSVAGGVATVSLRGLGAERTLVLVDGVRLPKHPELAAVDLNSIPIAAIQKVEVLRQSASAVYGADAVGGVINIITKRDYAGTQVQLQARKPTKPGGDSQSLSVTSGFSTEASNSVVIFSYDRQNMLIAKDRDFSRDRTSNTGYPGSYSGTFPTGSETYAVEGCPNFSSTSGQIDRTEGCDYNYNNHNALMPEYDRFSGLYNFTYDMPNNKVFTLKLMGTHQKSKSQLRPEGTIGRDLNPTIAASVIQNMDDARFNELFPGFGGRRPTGGVRLDLRLADFGNSITEKEANLVGLMSGLEGSFANGWDWKVGVNASGTTTSSDSRPKLLIAPTNQALAEGRLIPWDPNYNLQSLRESLVSYSHYLEKANTAGLEVQTSGEVGTFNGKPVAVAVGASAQTESYDVKWSREATEGALLNVAGAPGKGDRNVVSLFAETNLEPLDKVEAGVAVRFDKYSDFDATFNPQLSLSYAPLELLKLRGSYGTAFKAPSLDQMYGSTGVSYNPVVDYQYCADQNPTIERDDCPNNRTAAQAVKNVRSANEDLDPEKSDVYAFGVVVQALDNLSITADYWRIKSRDLIDYRNLQDLVDENDPAVVVRNPANNNLIEYINLPIQNLSKEVRSGIEAGIDYSERFGASVFSYQALGSWYLENKLQPRGKPEENKLGANGNFKWKLNNSLDLFVRETYGVTLTANTIGTHAKVADDSQRLPQYTRYDAQTRYRGQWNGEIALGINNVLNKQGGIDDTSFGDVDASIYDIQGREYYLRVTQNF